MSCRCLEDIFARRLEDVLKTKTNIFVLIKTSWRRLKDVFWRRKRKTSSRRLQVVFIKTNVWWDYFEKYYILIAIDLSKQQALKASPIAIQQISFTANLDWDQNTTVFFTIEKSKETILYFSQGTVKVLSMCSTIWYQ